MNTREGMRMWRVIRTSSFVGSILLCLVACGCLKTVASGKLAAPVLGAQATHADYDKVSKMSRADIDRALAHLGAGQRSSADEALKPGEGDVDPRVRQVWNVLSVVRYGSRDDYVYVGFDTKGIARAKALWLGSGTAKEWEQGTVSGANISGGKVTFDD
jgi:hypothetical protein